MNWFAIGLRGLGETLAEMADNMMQMTNASVDIELNPSLLKEQKEEAPPSQMEEPPEPPPLPEPPESPVTLDELKAVCAEKSKLFTVQVRGLILKYGATKLSDVDPAHYRDLLAEVMEIGKEAHS